MVLWPMRRVFLTVTRGGKTHVRVWLTAGVDRGPITMLMVSAGEDDPLLTA
jgi:hypothetical protein